MTKMKKILAVGLASVLAVSFAACSNGSNSGDDKSNDAAAVKTGLGVVANIEDAEDTKMTIDVVAAAVTVDADGKIVDVKLDEAQTIPDLTKADADYGVDLRTKYEKKDDYGMRSTSEAMGIGKEWYEQADAFMTWAKGKTADEIKAAAGTDGKSTDADLSAGCTITVSYYTEAVAKAIENAADFGATTADTLSLKLATEKYYESDETNLQYDTNIAAVTTSADGKITSCLIDAAQGKGAMKDGKFTVKDGSFLSKQELKEDYGMKSVSASMGNIPNGGEWYEQAAAYQKWAVGKTADEIKAAVGEDGYASDADLKAGCTITISSIAETVAAAATVA